MSYSQTIPIWSDRPFNYFVIQVDVSHVRAKFHTAMAIIAERSEIRVGDRVFIKVSQFITL